MLRHHCQVTQRHVHSAHCVVQSAYGLWESLVLLTPICLPAVINPQQTWQTILDLRVLASAERAAECSAVGRGLEKWL